MTIVIVSKLISERLSWMYLSADILAVQSDKMSHELLYTSDQKKVRHLNRLFNELYVFMEWYCTPCHTVSLVSTNSVTCKDWTFDLNAQRQKQWWIKTFLVQQISKAKPFIIFQRLFGWEKMKLFSWAYCEVNDLLIPSLTKKQASVLTWHCFFACTCDKQLTIFPTIYHHNNTSDSLPVCRPIFSCHHGPLLCHRSWRAVHTPV